LLREFNNEKILRFSGEEKRLNIPTANIFNCQQRITTNDMTANLTNQYNFTLIKVPLINPDGTCNLSSQYTDDRINELKLNNNTWTAQYQQESIAKVDMAFIGQMFDIDKLRESEGKPAPSASLLCGDNTNRQKSFSTTKSNILVMRRVT
jgi:hypothetical protein